MTDTLRSTVPNVCTGCIAGYHEECSTSMPAEDGEWECCCGGTMTLREMHLLHQAAEEALAKGIFGDDEIPAGDRADTRRTAPAPTRGNSGYIHPDAWGSTKDIGTLVDPESTGRKRMAKLYPIAVGQVCEWAGRANAGGEYMPVGIVGCVNNPATDLHHGPDKNTLNNEKASRGVGENENIHVICSDCHNSTHAANDEFYPPYDRVADQERPWLPRYPAGWEPTPEREATVDELFAEEVRRTADRKRRGRKTRGRNSRARGRVDTSVDGADED